MCIIETVIAGMLDVNSLVANISPPTEQFFVLIVEGIMPDNESSIQSLADKVSSFIIHLALVIVIANRKHRFNFLFGQD